MDEHRSAVRSIMIASNALDGIYAMAAKELQMKENTLKLLYALDDGREHSQADISRKWMIPKTTLNTIVKECIQRGIITLAPGTQNKEKPICLTEKGRVYTRKNLNRIYECEEKAYLRALEQFSPEFAAALARFCDCLGQEMSDCFKKPHGERNSA